MRGRDNAIEPMRVPNPCRQSHISHPSDAAHVISWQKSVGNLNPYGCGTLTHQAQLERQNFRDSPVLRCTNTSERFAGINPRE